MREIMSLLLLYLAYVVIGSIAGILGGLLGIGGGIITVPCFLYLFHLLGYPQGDIMHMAVATSLAAMVFSTSAATWAHNRKKNVLWGVFFKMVPGLSIGSVLGAIIAIWLSGVLLEVFFGIFLCLLACRFYSQKPVEHEHHKLPSITILSFFAACIGALSNLLGIGGGSLTVPLLSTYKVSDKKAIGTAAATTLFTTLLGTAAYLLLSWHLTPIPGNMGLINTLAFLIVGLTAFVVAPLGVKLTHQLPSLKIRKIFAIVLALTGVSLIF